MNVKYYHGFLLPVVEFKYLVGNYSRFYPERKLPATLTYQGDTLRIEDLRNSQFAEYKWWYKYL